ncbi:50S ribosomal protein L21 [Candidatus Roizmanbacteria bacterium CG09_land_8_20_14_0_10_41_9]|uniref:50S ribosomal protein L21 n=1 Tax=Candidatus Roizmanbacteria bacterium CG09_land_8_20_14_0_10_41_9 TaxID=1974850 RepID=A0A2H0WV61_9BACT|nr:MAG: 50S ribosomal protein L21 [Candidatus Roizmanbacteria bacterium CG09_land_8_20_14_0_10_41_9]
MHAAVIKTGGKQYLVKTNDEIIIDKVNAEKKKVLFDVLATLSEDSVLMGNPLLKEKAEGEIIEELKGDKIRVARFKSKVRYRKVKGFRPQLTRVKITKIP